METRTQIESRGPQAHASDLASLAIRNVLEKHQKQMKDEIGKNGHNSSVFDSHLHYMKQMLGNSSGYEVIPYKLLIKRSKDMNQDELRRFISGIETLANVYHRKLGDIALPILTGLIVLSDSPEKIEQHIAKIACNMEEKQAKYEKIARRYRERVIATEQMLKKEESSLFRIFRKRRISTLRKRMHFLSKAHGDMQKKSNTYKEMMETVTLPNLGKPRQ